MTKKDIREMYNRDIPYLIARGSMTVEKDSHKKTATSLHHRWDKAKWNRLKVKLRILYKGYYWWVYETNECFLIKEGCKIEEYEN